MEKPVKAALPKTGRILASGRMRDLFLGSWSSLALMYAQRCLTICVRGIDSAPSRSDSSADSR
eukprot:CAMPEP_0172160004 /NCGR_PEP_ID=MMETSP1050-20130122/5308_1 /TAXON_ID=233186 /ORGANISM="Cryptomonas curvata, Strain CCAP979/52" /LENGTH=62 /DNA_ID=CAMNT_0012829701 /DNA_START=182 /DNA_END=366 /DNA_ORIENTATION=-